MHILARHLFETLIIAGILGCAKPVSQEELIQEAIKLRVAQWKLAQQQDCRARTLERADAYVDSLLLATSLQQKLDTIPKPDKPERPERPVFRQKPDSVIIQRKTER